jgi:hypothetical protein
VALEEQAQRQHQVLVEVAVELLALDRVRQAAQAAAEAEGLVLQTVLLLQPQAALAVLAQFLFTTKRKVKNG